ncbi:MAG: Formamidase [Promethearchaeota archaeon]|nr:MAG: Formamidase [Candidatus Lokiarchaeota archaeon]
MQIACLQPRILDDRSKCYSHIKELMNGLISNHPYLDFVILPERWVPFNSQMEKNFQKERSDDYLFVKSLAKEYKINIISGAIWEFRKNKPDQRFITCYYFNDKGREIGRQEKIHLYTYESKYFEPGDTLKIFKYNEFYFAILICFDMAFYETPRLAAENGADILFSPTQIREDGMDNWKIYLQARALENRIPLAASNTLGSIFDRNFLGNSQIISFNEGPMTPSRLKQIQGPIAKSGYVTDVIDLHFPRKLRKIRLNEKIHKEKIKVMTLE